jgi:predicted regulator of Ras-like GTPase activity (Roadblock/LC7/MglB family)
MSSLTRNAKTKMTGFLQHLLRKLGDTPVPKLPAPAPKIAATAAPGSPGAGVSEAASLHNKWRHCTTMLNGGPHNGRGIDLSLQPILAGLPLELQPRLKHSDVGALTICIPLEKILAQLSTGVVRISFGELRQAAPDLFTPEKDRDHVLVPLPLAEILARLNPALIKRRREQKRVEVPADVCSPFDLRDQGLVFSVGPAHSEPAPVPPARSSITFAPTPPPPQALPLTPPSLSAASRALRDLAGSHAPGTAASVPPVPTPASNHPALVLSLPSLAQSWPEAVRKEIVQLNLVNAQVALPGQVVERALKQGRIAFTWKTLRSCIKPAILPAVSAHDSIVLELPLKTVAPMFLAQQQTVSKAQKKVSIDEDIPNLFFGFPQPEAGGAPPAPGAKPAPAKPADTNYYIWDDTSNRPRVQDTEVRPSPSPGTRFVAKYATPNEVVSRAAALEGVAGALIALPDGLMVASRLSADINGDTLAAFLPQIFGKVNQCTKELRMGELNNLNFTVGNVPWKIFRVNASLFAAFGRAGEPLPTAPLAALAAELDHRPK